MPGSRASTRARRRPCPGVVAVITGDDIKDQIAPLPQPVVVPNMPAKYPTHWPLAVGKVRFHGDALAAVVARDKYVAEDAAEAIEVDYEELPYVGDPEAALQADAPIVHEGWDNNLIFEMTFTGGATPEDQAKNEAKVQEAFDAADVVVRERFRCHRCGVTPMETRGALCLWDDADGLTAYVTTQRPHIDRLALSDILEHPGGEGPRHRAARSGRRLRRQGALLPGADHRRLHGATARSAGALDRVAPGAPDGGEPGARPDPRPRGRGHQGRAAAGPARSRYRRLRRRLRGGLLGLPDAVPRRRRAARTPTPGRWAT